MNDNECEPAEEPAMHFVIQVLFWSTVNVFLNVKALEPVSGPLSRFDQDR